MSGIKRTFYGSSGGGVADGSATFPLAHWGLLAANGDPIDNMSPSTLAAGQAWFTRMWIPAGVAITNLYVAVTTAAATHDGTTTGNLLGVYDDSGTRVAITAESPTMWSGGNGWRGAALVGGAIAAQGAGRWVYCAAIARGFTSQPAIAYPASPSDLPHQWIGPGQTKRRTFYLAGQTTLPTTMNPASTGTPTGYTPLFGVS